MSDEQIVVETKIEEPRAADAPWSGFGLCDQGWLAVPDIFLTHAAKLGLSSSEQIFILQVLKYKWDVDEDPFPSLETVADKMNIGHRYVQRIANSLVKKGFLQIHYNSGKSGANMYDFTGLCLKLVEIKLQLKKDKEIADELQQSQTQDMVADKKKIRAEVRAKMGKARHKRSNLSEETQKNKEAQLEQAKKTEAVEEFQHRTATKEFGIVRTKPYFENYESLTGSKINHFAPGEAPPKPKPINPHVELGLIRKTPKDYL